MDNERKFAPTTYDEQPQQGYPPPQGYPQQGYPPPQGYPQQGYPPPQQGFTPAQAYPPQPGYSQPGYPPPQGYPPQSSYPPPQGYPAQSYAPPPQDNYGPPPPQPPPYARPPVVAAVPEGGWFNRNYKNKPQSNAAGAAALIFLSGGMNIAWSVGFRSYYFFLLPMHTHLAFFIAAIIGAFLSCLLVNKIPKKFILVFCSLLVIIGGIIRAATRYNRDAIEASLYLDGIANGMAFAPTIALAGEVSVPYIRGTITATLEQMSFMLGFFIQIVYTESWGSGTGYYYTNDFTSDQMHGVLSAIYGLIAMIVAGFLCIESPVMMLANGEEQHAIDALRRLQRPYIITTETYSQLEEHKRYLAHNKEMSRVQSIIQGLPALVRLCFLRALNAMSLSLFMFYALFVSISPRFSLYRYTWEYVIFGLCRYLGTILTSFCMESAGRKIPTLLGVVVSGALAIVVGSLFDDFPHGPIDSAFSVLCVYQVFAGLAFTPSSVYLSEAYPLGVKQHFISFTFMVEMLVYLIISSVSFNVTSIYVFFYFLGAFSIFAFFMGIWCLPETKGTTLREAQDKFRGVFNRPF